MVFVAVLMQVLLPVATRMFTWSEANVQSTETSIRPCLAVVNATGSVWKEGRLEKAPCATSVVTGAGASVVVGVEGDVGELLPPQANVIATNRLVDVPASAHLTSLARDTSFTKMG